jgi:transcriptional regulator GlxA family with amidase domain
MAEKVKTNLKVEGRKQGFERRSLMLRSRLSCRDDETANRLRRGLGAATNRRMIEVMARAACFSPRQFHRLTVDVLGETPAAHQRRVRLDRGAWLLLTSHATVLDVALESGFENHETFTRAFRKRFGVAPSVFRKTRGKELPRSMRVAFSLALHAHHA